MFRRKRSSDPHVEQVRAAFSAVAVHVDRAQRALLEAVPKPRDDGAPLAQALATFGSALADAAELMPGWQDPLVAGLWQRCFDAIGEARHAADRLRMIEAPLSFEALNEAIGDALAPLEEFADADRAVRRL